MNYCPECGHDLKQYTTKPAATVYYLKIIDGSLVGDAIRQCLGMAHVGDVVTITQTIIDQSMTTSGLRDVHEPGRYRILNIDRTTNRYPSYTLYCLDRLEKA